MVNIVNNNNSQYNHLVYDPSLGQKFEKRGQDELPPMVIEQKENVPSAREEVPREEVEKAAEKLNRLMGLLDKRMEFKIHEGTKRIMVKIVNRDNGDVLSEIPPEKVLDIIGSIQEMVGLIVDQKA